VSSLLNDQVSRTQIAGFENKLLDEIIIVFRKNVFQAN
jgi:hypothetical protein